MSLSSFNSRAIVDTFKDPKKLQAAVVALPLLVKILGGTVLYSKVSSLLHVIL